LLGAQYALDRAKGPTEVIPVGRSRALEGGTLSPAAQANRRHVISFDEAMEVVAVPNGRAFSYRLNIPDASACEMVSPGRSGVTTATTMRIEPSNAWYPRPNRPVIFRIQCLRSDGTSVGDSAMVVLQQPIGARWWWLLAVDGGLIVVVVLLARKLRSPPRLYFGRWWL
jgi:hypothetical protein